MLILAVRNVIMSPRSPINNPLPALLAHDSMSLSQYGLNLVLGETASDTVLIESTMNYNELFAQVSDIGPSWSSCFLFLLGILVTTHNNINLNDFHSNGPPKRVIDNQYEITNRIGFVSEPYINGDNLTLLKGGVVSRGIICLTAEY